MSLSASPEPGSTASFVRKVRGLRTSYCLSLAGKYFVLAASVGVSTVMTLLVLVDVTRVGPWGALGVLALAIAVVILLTVLRAPSLASLARRIDREFGLEDRVLTALEHEGCDDEMAVLLLADAERRLPSNWKGKGVWNFRREIQMSALVLVISVVAAFSVRSLIEFASPGSNSFNTGLVSGPVGESEGTATVGGIAAVPSAAPTAVPTAVPDETGRAAQMGLPESSAGLALGPVSSGNRNIDDPPGTSSQVPSDAPRVLTEAAAAGEGRSGPSEGGSERANASSAGSSPQSTPAQFEGAAGSGTGAAPSDVGPGSSGGASSVDGVPTLLTDAARSSFDPRQGTGYSASWSRGQAIPLTERIPSGLRRYIRAYFTAIEP